MGQLPFTNATLEAEDARGRQSPLMDSTDQADADPVNEYEEEEGGSRNHQAGSRSSLMKGNAAGAKQHRGQVAVSKQHPRYQTCKLVCHTEACANIEQT